MTCELCGCQLSPTNASGWCAECTLLVVNRLDVAVEERWRDLDGLVVSERGRVARLLPVDSSHRYPRVSVAGQKRYVHQLVAEAWHGPRPDGALALHHDDDPDNPDARNLRWGSHADNAEDARRNRKSLRHNITGTIKGSRGKAPRRVKGER